jgi:hypothetical protein
MAKLESCCIFHESIQNIRVFLCGIMLEPVVRCAGNDEIKILTHIQTNIHRKFGQGGGNTPWRKPGFFLIFRDSFAATALYFRVSAQLCGKGSVDRERTSVTRCGTQWVLVHNRQGCIQHGDIVNKAFA